ncbi:MAG: hypothetical protein KGH87_02255 [Thaumarchaeota archaeon]|nr:hypothetical protein [Nitrososphaerota archaeon]MDE1838721.1 hypothetical protein [Nitrososphaerota archaeon]
MVKVVEVADSERIGRTPDKTVVLLSGGKFLERGHVVQNVTLNLYIQRKDEKLGPYSLITALVETDKGMIEMTYDEGYRGENAIEEATAFLTSHIGISALILRSIIQLDQSMNKNNLVVIEQSDQGEEFYEV